MEYMWQYQRQYPWRYQRLRLEQPQKYTVAAERPLLSTALPASVTTELKAAPLAGLGPHGRRSRKVRLLPGKGLHEHAR